MKINHYLIILCLLMAGSIKAQPKKDELRTLIVFFDGLRPDYITAENMPNLYALKQKSAYGDHHHSVFPTVTRVNATSYATGSYPGTHGLLGNSVYFPAVNKTRALDTGNASDIDKINESTGNELLTTISLGELIQKSGSHLMVFSSGTTGQALMQNHTIAGGAVINPQIIRPESMRSQIMAEIGEVKPGSGKHVWITDAFVKYGLKVDGPKVSAIWYGDPDGNAHRDGVAAPSAIAAIKDVDREFGRIISEIDHRGLSDRFNIIISSDHGFVTHVGEIGFQDFLISKGLKKDANSDDVVLAGGAIYVKDHNPAKIQQIVTALQQEPWVGSVFTQAKTPGNLYGSVPGTLSFDAIHWAHPTRSADILADANWDDRKSPTGYPGTGFARGVAGHGGFSPYEVKIPLIAEGPSFKKGLQSNLPSSNVDIVPTILHLHGIEIPAKMDGRIMYELLAEESPEGLPTRARTDTIQTSVNTPAGIYRLSLERSVLGNYIYLNKASVTRNNK